MDNKTQRFKFSLPIIKTYIEITKDDDGNEKEVRFVEGIASSTDKDLHGDKMAPSAIKTMAESLKLHVINLNSEHDTSWQSELGELIELDVTKENQLRIKARLNEMSKATDLWYALTDLNKKLGLSIGGFVKEYEMEKDESGDETRWMRVYKDIELDHIAVTSRPANPKTWVSVISKSIETSEKTLKEVSKRIPATYNKEQTMKELAHKIVRSIQNMEADLLLEMTEVGLSYMNDEQINLIERNLPMKKKDVSLKAEEAKKADTSVKPEDEKVETPAASDNGSSEEESKVEETKEEAKETETTDAEATEDKAEEPTEKSEGDEAESKEAEASGEETEAETEESETEKDESEDESGKEEATEESEEDTKDAKSEESDEEESEEKSEKVDNSQLLKAVEDLTGSLKEMVKANGSLTKRIEELESQPADRKTIAIKKAVGDDDTEEVNPKALKKERDEKIAELRKTQATNPALFSLIQRVRSEYASKISQ